MRTECMLIGLSVVLLGAGCGQDKSQDSGVTNAAAPVAAPAPAKPANAAASESADASLMISGPIVVEHQVELGSSSLALPWHAPAAGSLRIR